MIDARTAVGTVGTLTVLLTAGCGSTITPPTPQPATPAPSPSAGPDSPYAARARAVIADPCTGLSPAALKPVLGEVRARDAGEGTNGKICVWQGKELSAPSVTVQTYRTLRDEETLRSTGSAFKYNKPAASALEGLPTQHVSPNADGPANGDCESDVLISGVGTIGVSVVAADPATPQYHAMCTVADQLVLRMLKGEH